MSHSGRRASVHVVTQAHRSLSDDIAYRQRRYLLMMGIRAVCFVIAVVLFVNHFARVVAQHKAVAHQITFDRQNGAADAWVVRRQEADRGQQQQAGIQHV